MKEIFRPFSHAWRGLTLAAALCGFVCLCLGVFAAPAWAGGASRTAARTTKADAKKPGWDFHESDKSVLNARWKESIAATLRKTTFAPSAPAGRWLQRDKATAGELPPTLMENLDKLRPPEPKKILLGDVETPITGEFTKETAGWRPDTPGIAAAGESHVTGSEPVLREEHRAGAYAGFHPDEDVELKLGPEYYFSSQTMRPEQTGRVKNSTGAFGMGMQLKIDF